MPWLDDLSVEEKQKLQEKKNLGLISEKEFKSAVKNKKENANAKGAFS